jgi:hypothetical protein
MSNELKKGAALLASAIAAGSGIVVISADDEAAATYHEPWSRTNAYNLGSTGLNEGYEYGHSKWNDNNVPEAWPTEGADCSGYAGKVWAAPAYTSIGTDYSYPYTGTWYSGGVDGSVLLDRNDPRNRQMDVWVIRTAYGGESDHMGVYEGTYDTTYQWKIWHGSGEPSGITSGYHTTAWFDQNNAKRYKRANW